MDASDLINDTDLATCVALAKAKHDAQPDVPEWEANYSDWLLIQEVRVLRLGLEGA